MGKRKTGRRFNPLQTNNSVAEPLFPQFTKQNPLPLHPFSHNSVSLREVSTGKLQTKGGARNPRSFLKLDHLKNLAVWASKDASIPSLAAFFGRQVAAAGETIAAPPDLDTVSCQRCETILCPDFNCTVRFEKARLKPRSRSKRHGSPMQNRVVYKCHFCSHKNFKRGTSRGHMKALCQPKLKSATKVKPAKPIEASVGSGKTSSAEITKRDETVLLAFCANAFVTNSLATPSGKSGTSLLDAKRKRRNKSGTKKPTEMVGNSSQANSGSTIDASHKRKRRKSWTTLKEISVGSLKNNFPVPLFL